MLKRIQTGIPGLDNIIEGGFLPGSVILVSGEAGTGKTIFSMQFLWNAIKLGMKGLYVSLQQLPEDIKDDTIQFIKDFESMERAGKCKIVYVDLQRLKRLVEIILDFVESIDAKILVIDSITLMCEASNKPLEIRYSLIKLIKELKKRNITTLMISEVPEGSNMLSRYGVEEFMVDGVIILKAGVDIVGGKPRSLVVKKMRKTTHDLNSHPFEITKKGINIIEED